MQMLMLELFEIKVKSKGPGCLSHKILPEAMQVFALLSYTQTHNHRHTKTQIHTQTHTQTDTDIKITHNH